MKTALITGASRGIGAETARVLSREGWFVIVNYNATEGKALELARELNAVAVKADVSDPRQVRDMFEKVGPVDLLVNNAGIAHYGLFTDTSEETWRRLFAVNVDGIYNCCQCALPYMIREKRGCIINISSIWGIKGASCEVAYSAAKAAVIGFTKALAKEVGPSGVRVNCVAPGVVETNMLVGFTEEDKAELTSETPLGRLGTAGEIAELIAFLASDKARFITGQVVAMDGGFAL
ncbi:MAG: elongation factor P 5-aminopentanone reductase [Oscillospiraceae bacterium]|jgi:3-oxoacyl-[acyl-carrier protein] reductase